MERRDLGDSASFATIRLPSVNAKALADPDVPWTVEDIPQVPGDYEYATTVVTPDDSWWHWIISVNEPSARVGVDRNYLKNYLGGEHVVDTIVHESLHWAYEKRGDKWTRCHSLHFYQEVWFWTRIVMRSRAVRRWVQEDNARMLATKVKAAADAIGAACHAITR